MTLQYEEIFSVFLGKCTSYDFLTTDEQYLHETWSEYLRSTISKPYIRRIFSKIKLDKTIESLDFELKNSVDEDSDMDFVLEILAKGLVIEWLEPQVKSVVNISQMFGGKEEKYFSQAQHLKEIKDLLSDTKLELRKMIRDYGYINNSYISEV